MGSVRGAGVEANEGWMEGWVGKGDLGRKGEEISSCLNGEDRAGRGGATASDCKRPTLYC